MGLIPNEKRNEVVRVSLSQVFYFLKKFILILVSAYKKEGFVPKLLSCRGMSSRGYEL